MKKITANITGSITAFVADSTPDENATGEVVLLGESTINTHCNARAHFALASRKLYVLVVVGGTDTVMHGPVTTVAEQNLLAREIRKNRFSTRVRQHV